MSTSAPSWRLASRGLSRSQWKPVPSSHTTHLSLPLRTRTPQIRSLHLTTPLRAENDDAPKKPNPVLDQFLRDNPGAGQATQPGQPQQIPADYKPGGDLPATSIFEDDRRAQEQVAQNQTESAEGTPAEFAGTAVNPRNRMSILDPDPASRERYQRKKVIQLVRRGGRLTKEEFIKRTEREHLVKSHNMKTSVKKLGMLARQIQGKTIDDAITQMRFSRKKVATEVMKQLEFARDEAVVMRGMGLARVKVEEEAKDAESLDALVEERELDDKAVDVATAKEEKAVEIQLKDGKRHKVTDPSKIYIDQVWVGRGPYGKLPDYRARGQIYIMRTPFTSITLLLKEEATRVREATEREAKRRRKVLEKVWVPLPDRPIQTKSQWYSW